MSDEMTRERALATIRRLLDCWPPEDRLPGECVPVQLAVTPVRAGDVSRARQALAALSASPPPVPPTARRQHFIDEIVQRVVGFVCLRCQRDDLNPAVSTERPDLQAGDRAAQFHTVREHPPLGPMVDVDLDAIDIVERDGHVIWRRAYPLPGEASTAQADSGFRYGLPDDEMLPLRRCACGQEFASWDFTLGAEELDARECPNCRRRLWWSQQITIHEVPADRESQ